jgi:hypothetical protein
MMSRPASPARGTVHAGHHAFWLADVGYPPQSPLSSRNGLIAVQPGAAVIFTGIHTGVVAVSIEVRDVRPEQVDGTGWDDVVEVSLEAIGGRVLVVGPFADTGDVLPVLTPAGPGHYRVRVHVRGRDTAVDGVAFEPFEEYLIIVWPDRPAPDTVHKQTDGYGASVRAWPPDARPAPEGLDEHQQQ